MKVHCKKQNSKSSNKKQKEKLSTNDIEELMGMNRDIYTRKNGAIRRR